MLKTNFFLHFSAALTVGVLIALARPALAADTGATPKAAVADMTAQMESLGLGMTPDKTRALERVVASHMGDLTPELDAMGRTMTKAMDNPETRAAMDKITREMTGVMIKQAPVMMQAMQPVLADMLPRLLRMQADMLQVLFAPPPAESAKK